MSRTGSSTRARIPRAACVLAIIAAGMVAVAPRSVPAAPGSTLDAPVGPDVPRAMLVEFRTLCAELAEVRDQLAAGRLAEPAFADSILALFERADSLAQRLATAPRGPSWMTMQRGMGYLISSLRDNWIGIAAQDGMSFAEADLALKAAVAWRSGVVELASP